jgi:hypothetical protein
VDEIRLEINLTSQDLRRYTGWVTRRIVHSAGILAFVVIFGFLVVTSHFIVDNPPYYLRYMALGILICGPLSLMFCLKFLLARVSYRSAKRRGRETYCFREEEISSERKGKTEKMSWAFYCKAVETRYELRLVAHDGSVVQLPKRCFTNDEQLGKLRELFIQQLGKDVFIKG